MGQQGMCRRVAWMLAAALCVVWACAVPAHAWADEGKAAAVGEAATLHETDDEAKSAAVAEPAAEPTAEPAAESTAEPATPAAEPTAEAATPAAESATPAQADGGTVQQVADVSGDPKASDAPIQGADTSSAIRESGDDEELSATRDNGENRVQLSEEQSAQGATTRNLEGAGTSEGEAPESLPKEAPNSVDEPAQEPSTSASDKETPSSEAPKSLCMQDAASSDSSELGQEEVALGAVVAGAAKPAQKQDATVQQATSKRSVKLAKATRTLLSSAGGRLHLALAANRVHTRTLADGLYSFATALDGKTRLESKGGSGKAGAAAGVFQDNNTVTQRWNITYVGTGYYRVQNANGDNALAVAQAKKKSNVNAQLQKWDGTDAQKWKIVAGTGGYRFVSALSPWLSLSVYGGAAHNAMNVQVHAMRSEKSQVWKPTAIKRTISDGVYRIVSQKSGLSATVHDASLSNGANVEQQRGSATLGQVFQATYQPKTGYYTFTTPFGTRLDVAGGSSASGANVCAATSNNTAAQNWSVVRNANGSYRLVSAIWGHVLDVADGSTKAGANLQVFTSNNTAAQKFTFSRLGNWIEEGAYQVFTALNRENALQVERGSTSAGANIQTGAADKGNAQRFYFRPVGSGAYTIQNTASGMFVGAASSKAQENVRTQAASVQWVPTITASGVVFALKANPKVALDVYGGSKDSGANIWLYERNGTQAQSFAMRKTGMLADGLYAMASILDTKYMWDDRAQSRANGERLQVAPSNGTIAQEYYLTRLASGAYRITSAASGKVLQAMGAGNAQVQQQAAANTAAQQFNLVMNSDGSVTFLSVLGSNKTAITLGASKPALGTKVDMATNTSSKRQHWRVRELNKPTYNYDRLSITLNQFATYQFNSPYNSGYTFDQMYGFVNPDNLSPYEFVDLRVGTGVTAAQLDEYLRTHGAVGGHLLGLGSAFVEGAKANGLNEVYLLANAIMESGWGKSTLASGYAYGGGMIDGEYYPAGTYHNFYGIGAYDTSPLSGGRKLAIINGWSSPAKAVTGAAEWLAKNYIYRSEYTQPTLYAMRWDYAYSDVHKTRGWHQYASGVHWGGVIAKLMGEIYASAKVDVNHTYVIPKFAS